MICESAIVDVELLAQAWSSKTPFAEGRIRSSDPRTQAALDAFLSDGYDGLRRTIGERTQRVTERASRGGPFHPKTIEVATDPAGARGEPQAVRLTLDDVTHPPRESYVIGNMIPFGKSSTVFGPTSVGKSAALAQILFSFASGAESLWGLPLHPGGGPVLVYTAEDTIDDWRRKAGAIHCAGGVDMVRALERLLIVDQSEGVARLSEVVTVRRGDGAESVSQRIARPTYEQDRLISMARAAGAKVILVETASRLVEDEDNASFSGLQSALGRIGRETGAAVIVTHHATKAASKDNDSGIENARGGGALIYNARNALSLFPADPELAKPYADRFPAEDVVVLAHGKPSSSSRRSPPLTLVRCDATHGAVFRLPTEVSLSPEQEQANAARVERAREQEWEHLRTLYEVVERTLGVRPSLSPSWLRDHASREIGVSKHRVEPLVLTAIDRGVLKERTRTDRGITIGLGFDPRRSIAEAIEERANAGESSIEAIP